MYLSQTLKCICLGWCESVGGRGVCLFVCPPGVGIAESSVSLFSVRQGSPGPAIVSWNLNSYFPLCLWKEFLITATSDLIIIQDLKTCHSERGFSWWWWLWWRWCWWWWWWCRWWCCPDTLVTVSKAFLLELFAEANSPPSQFDRQVTRWLYTMYIQSL